MKTLGVIVARGGSKRLPDKNMRLLGGHPLVAWTVRAALSARSLSHVIVSTDCPRIAASVREYGAQAPFLRPAHLSTDSAQLEPVLAHALEYCAGQAETYSNVFLLHATSPFRTGEHIDGAMAQFAEGAAHTLTMVCPVREHAYYQFEEQGGLLSPVCGKERFAMPRHKLPPLYIENGAGYIIDVMDIKRGSIYGETVMPYYMNLVSSTDIDTLEDFQQAEYFLHAGYAPMIQI